ncbi:MAG: hypothetical protein ABI638_12350 [Ignavibacteriota bacterium]
MNSYTTTVDAKELIKILPLPKEFMNMKFKVTLEPIHNEKKVLREMKKIFQEAKKIRVSPKINVDKIADEINAEIF